MLYAIIAVIAIILDQLVKYVVESRVVLDAIGEDVVRLLPGFVHITNVHNFGAAFSFLEGARWFFVILCIVFVLVVVYVLIKDIINTPVARWMAIFVLAGAVGNCIDRIICGYVVDMFEFEFFRFPVFNVADIYITLGAIAFCLCVLLEKPKDTPKKVTGSVIPQAEAPAVEANAVTEIPVVPETHAAEESPKERKPLIRKHQKVQIPDFPKRPPMPAAPAIDPNDPFAEWEKRAGAPKEAPEQTPAHTVYTQPPAAEAAPFVPSEPVAAPEAPEIFTEVIRPDAPAAPAASEIAAPEIPAAPADAVPAAKPEPAAESYNLDDILAEFKDL